MKLTNERKCEDTMFDVDMTDEEVKFLTEYGKEHISDEALIQFAMVDILTNQMEAMKTRRKADMVNDVCANAAELGCPEGKEVDMWYRELTNDEQCEIISHVEEITGSVYEL